MKRWIILVCAFLVFFGGAASAWARCKQNTLTADKNARVSVPFSSHHQKTDSHHHDHSHETVLHCPDFAHFLPTARFSASSESRMAERILDVVSADLGYRFAAEPPHRALRAPPGLAPFNDIPSYLLLSVLRI